MCDSEQCIISSNKARPNCADQPQRFFSGLSAVLRITVESGVGKVSCAGTKTTTAPNKASKELLARRGSVVVEVAE